MACSLPVFMWPRTPKRAVRLKATSLPHPGGRRRTQAIESRLLCERHSGVHGRDVVLLPPVFEEGPSPSSGRGGGWGLLHGGAVPVSPHRPRFAKGAFIACSPK